jgi:hypothetical protein
MCMSRVGILDPVYDNLEVTRVRARTASHSVMSFVSKAPMHLNSEPSSSMYSLSTIRGLDDDVVVC